MGKIDLVIHDGSATEDTTNERTATVDLQRYQVIVDGGIFKRGKLWKKGAIIELDKQTGQRFVDNKELKQI